jgi:hypothetical protein
MVQARQRLDEHIHAFVAILVAASREVVEGVFKIEVQMSIKVTPNEFMNLLLLNRVEVLEFVNRGKLLHVETVGQDTVRFTLQQMLAFERGDVRHGCEDIGSMSSGSFNAISVVYASLAGLGVDIKVLQVVVEVDRACAQVPAEEGGVRGEDGRDIDLALFGKGKSNACEPFVELSDYSSLGFSRDELKTLSDVYRLEGIVLTSPKNHATK